VARWEGWKTGAQQASRRRSRASLRRTTLLFTVPVLRSSYNLHGYVDDQHRGVAIISFACNRIFARAKIPRGLLQVAAARLAGHSSGVRSGQFPAVVTEVARDFEGVAVDDHDDRIGLIPAAHDLAVRHRGGDCLG